MVKNLLKGLAVITAVCSVSVGYNLAIERYFSAFIWGGTGAAVLFMMKTMIKEYWRSLK